MTERELLVSTVQFYTKFNRAIKDGACVYLNEDTNRCCAIGRYLVSDACIVYDNDEVNNLSNTAIDTIFDNDRLKKLAPKWMQDVNIEYLTNIQQLHDEDSNWTDIGISDRGKETVNNICFKYKLEPLTPKEYEHKQQ